MNKNLHLTIPVTRVFPRVECWILNAHRGDVAPASLDNPV